MIRVIFFLIFLTGCYRSGDSLRECERSSVQFQGETEYALVVLVDARHLDYSSPSSYLTTLSQTPFSHTGHAWVLLIGKQDGHPWIFEGGHTGEFGRLAPRYFDELVQLSRCKDPNPAKYLFSPLPDGRLEIGSGDHKPTLAAAFSITKEGFDRIMRLFDPDGYDFSQWGLRGPHCVHFVLSCLACVDVDLSCQKEIDLPSSFTYNGEKIALWTDSAYSRLTTETPELLEEQLIDQVYKGGALVATKWYRKMQTSCNPECA